MDKDKYIGKLLDDRYEILEVIGTGGMAVVYRARCRRLNRMVAIKILKDEFSQDEEFRRRFHAESQAVAMLSHPNIVSVYDVSSSEDSDYIVMELIDGITLKYYMEKKGVLNWKETLHFAMQIAKALEHAHSRGIVHRDIKPHNVMVLKNGSVKVADFGIAQVMSTGSTMTQEALGSVHYISPEQAKGSRVDSRSDVYSLGIVMYEMISGRVPYDGDTPVSVVMKHINGGAQLPTTLNPNTPKGLEQIIMKAMAQQPKDRYATATSMLYDMDEFRKNPTMLLQESRPAEKEPMQVTPGPAPEKEEKTIAQKKVQPEKQPVYGRSRTATIAIASCAVVGLVAVIILLLLLPSCQKESNQVTVPDLIGKYYDELPSYADIIIQKQGDGEPSTEFAAGQIIYQSPEAGEQVTKGSKVFIIISLGAQTMPDVTDMTVDQAQQALWDLKMGLKVTPVMENSAQIPKDGVIRTDPAAGTPLKLGQEVKVYYSIGKEIKTGILPNVMGLPLEDAKTMLTEAQFSNLQEQTVDSKLPVGTVVGLSVKTGEMLDLTQENKLDVTKMITIYVSGGIPMEDLTTMTMEDALKYLDDLDMELEIKTQSEPNGEVAVGMIIRTEPAMGEPFATGDTITIYYSGITVIPDVRGKSLQEAKDALNEAGFSNLREKETSSYLPKGTVVQLSEDPGVQADVSKQIVIYISVGDQGLKDLTGTTLEEAERYLDSLGLGLTYEAVLAEDSSLAAGCVVRTEPAAGSTVKFGQKVTIYCSAGPVLAVVPDVEGYTLAEAQNALNEAGFYKLTIQEMDGDRPAGQVLRLNVAAGDRVTLDTAIVIYVSRGNGEITMEKLFVIPPHDDGALVTITCDGETVFELELASTENTAMALLTGSGTKQYQIYINGVLSGTETVEFDPL